MQAIRPKFKYLLIFAIIVFTGCQTAPEDVPTVMPEAPAVEEADTETAVSPTPEPTANDESPQTETDSTSGLASIGDPYAPELGNTGYDVQHYNIQMNLDPEQAYEVEGTVTIEGLSTEPNLGELSLDFVGFDINELTVNGETAVYNRSDDKLIITLPEPVPADEPFTIVVSYAGESVQTPSEYVGFASWLGLFYGQENTLYILSEPDGSRYWFPNNDHPRDKATFRFEVTVPDGYTAVANGTLLAQEDNTFIWEHNHPMASYLATIAVGEYERIDDESPAGILLRHYAFRDQQELFENSIDVTGEAIDWMSELFGAYPYEEFGYVTVHAPGVSLETQTMVLLSTGMLDEQVVIHELAHMWFGDWVSLDSWGEMWRNEGFATYLSFMWDNRDDPEGLELLMEGIRASFEDDGELPPLANPEPQNLFSRYTYVGGALMIHDLRQEMGDDAFFDGLRNYFQMYGGGTASDDQFIAIMEEASGKDLSAFFDEWLN